MDFDIRFADADADKAAVTDLWRRVNSEMGRAGADPGFGHLLGAFDDANKRAGASAMILYGADGYPGYLDQLFGFSRFERYVPLDRTMFVGRLVIDKPFRLGSLPLDLFLALREIAAGTTAEVVFAGAEPYLVPLYQRLGFRRCGDGAMVKGGSGFVVPHALVTWDVSHQRRVGSPLAMTRWARHPQADNSDALQIGAMLERPTPMGSTEPDDDAEERAQETRTTLFQQTWAAAQEIEQGTTHLFHGLTPEQVKLYMANSEIIEVDAGEAILHKGDASEHRMYVVLDGVAEARDGKRKLRVMGEGSVFGEIGFLLDAPRTADVVAIADGTRVLSLSERHLELVAQVDPKLAYRLLLNVSKVLCVRLASG